MGFEKIPQIKHEELGVVLVSAPFIANLLTAENQIFRPSHGLRDVKVHAIVFDTNTNKLCALVSSLDIPAYVGLHKHLEDLEYYILNGYTYPLVGLGFEVLEVQNEHTDTDGMWYGEQNEDCL
jgi:hypothetical protein